jgi:phosphatidylserine/phosphatidylglycerophosphate/cardiolipin synthase-like enzyme
MTVDSTACRALGELLTGSEARELADRLGAGASLSQALAVVGVPRRQAVRAQLRAAGLGVAEPGTVGVLRAIEGALGAGSTITPIWTAPGNLAGMGHLHASVQDLISRARESVVCATYNFQRNSRLWVALQQASARPEVSVRIYVDTGAADDHPVRWRPTTEQVAAAMPGARVFRSATFDGARVRSHTKFVAVDHQYLVVTSANFSKPAEDTNIELGLFTHDAVLAQSVERQMQRLEEGGCYAPVGAP